MTLYEELLKSSSEPPTDPAKKILFAVLDDLMGRDRVLNLYGIDEETREELLETNLEIVRRNLP